MYHKMKVSDGAFPIYDKVIVNGPGSSPVYAFLKSSKMFVGDDIFGEVAWNYEKWLVNGDGVPVHRIKSQDDPSKLESAIRKLLGLADVTATEIQEQLSI